MRDTSLGKYIMLWCTPEEQAVLFEALPTTPINGLRVEHLTTADTVTPETQRDLIDWCLLWSVTPQGHSYWQEWSRKISDRRCELQGIGYDGF